MSRAGGTRRTDTRARTNVTKPHAQSLEPPQSRAADVFFDGFRDAAPFAAFLSLIYLGLGALCADRGLSLLDTLAMTALLYSTPLQVLLVQNLGAGPAMMLPVILILNARFALMAAVLARSLASERRGRIACAVTLLVPTVFANCRARFGRDGRHPLAYFLGVGLPLYVTSVLCSMAGYLLGAGRAGAGSLAFDRFALALFLTVLAGRLWPRRLEVAAFVIAFAATPALVPIFGSASVLAVPLLIGVALAGFGEARRLRA